METELTVRGWEVGAGCQGKCGDQIRMMAKQCIGLWAGGSGWTRGSLEVSAEPFDLIV